jgi:RNA 2',3'-cyclic 3'-phosphodiesterase
MARLFVGIDPPRAWKTALSAAVAGVGRFGGRPTAPGNLHLTVLFLGETDEAAVPGLIAALDRAVGVQSAFSLAFSGIIPKAERMLWAAFEDNPAWRRLCMAVGQAAAPFSPLSRDSGCRPQAAHATLARFKQGGARSAAIGAFTPPEPALPVSAADLIRSRLSPAGPSYVRERRFSLSGPGEA